MKYETPEMTALTPAINAIQSATVKEFNPLATDGDITENEMVGTYTDWE